MSEKIRLDLMEEQIKMNKNSIEKLTVTINDSLVSFSALKSTQKVILVISLSTFGMMATAFFGVIIKSLVSK